MQASAPRSWRTASCRTCRWCASSSPTRRACASASAASGTATTPPSSSHPSALRSRVHSCLYMSDISASYSSLQYSLHSTLYGYWYLGMLYIFAAMSARSNGFSWELAFIKSGFTGQLPKPFEGPPPNGSRLIPSNMNHLNLEEPTRYVCAHSRTLHILCIQTSVSFFLLYNNGCFSSTILRCLWIHATLWWTWITMSTIVSANLSRIIVSVFWLI